MEEQNNIDLIMNLINTDKIGDLSLRHDPRFSHLKYIIFPDDFIKGSWEMILAIAMSFTILVTPFRISFIEEEDDDMWTIINLAVDVIFGLDIPINFLSAYFDAHDNLVISRKLIAYNYFTGWFFF